jgi:hypothetical protein
VNGPGCIAVGALMGALAGLFAWGLVRLAGFGHALPAVLLLALPALAGAALAAMLRGWIRHVPPPDDGFETSGLDSVSDSLPDLPPGASDWHGESRWH